MVIHQKPVVVYDEIQSCNQNRNVLVNNENKTIMDKRNGQKLTETDIVGTIIGNLKCIKLNEAIHNKNNWKYVITVKCLYCGYEYTTTWSSFRSSSRKNTTGCIKCMGKRMIDSRTTETGLTQKERQALAQYKSRAKQKERQFDLTDEEFKTLFNSKCTYCGKQYAFGIDRIDSSKGYILKNCVPCCAICNRMKNSYTIEEFKTHITKLYNNFYNENQES